MVANIHTPAQPIVIGKSPAGQGIIRRIVLRDQLAYVAADRAGLRVFDISNTATPTEIGRYSALPAAVDVEVQGNLAYIADEQEGLNIIDISNPTDPTFVGQLTVPESATGVAVEGEYVYLTSVDFTSTSATVLRVVDVTDPSQPAVAQTTALNSYQFFDTAIADGYLYVGTRSSFEIYGISDPLNPQLAGSTTGYFDTVVQIELAGDFAYTISRWSLLKFDISDIANPSFLTENEMFDYGENIAASGDVVIVADRDAGLRFVENGSQLAQISPMFSVAKHLMVEGSHAFVAGNIDDSHVIMQVFDVSNPSNWQPQGSIILDGNSSLIALSGTYLFMSISGPGSFRVSLASLDVSDPMHPVLINMLVDDDAEYSPWGMDVQEVGSQRFVYLAAPSSGLFIFDVTDPAQPVLISKTPFSDAVLRVTVDNERAYVMVYDDSQGRSWDLHILDVSDPSEPQVLGMYDWSDAGYAMAVQGNRLYTANSQGGYSVFDVSDPADPQLETTLRTPGSSHSIQVDDRHVFLGTSDSVVVFTGDDLANPSQVDTFPMADYTIGLALLADQPSVGTRQMQASSFSAYLATAADEAGAMSVFFDEQPPTAVTLSSMQAYSSNRLPTWPWLLVVVGTGIALVSIRRRWIPGAR
ncbi:MAG: hypothetical protein KDI55_15730 [Anaerolineae bacterium]|nr:hypothetical protein [Anaerolineae bacterium]